MICPYRPVCLGMFQHGRNLSVHTHTYPHTYSLLLLHTQAHCSPLLLRSLSSVEEKTNNWCLSRHSVLLCVVRMLKWIKIYRRLTLSGMASLWLHFLLFPVTHTYTDPEILALVMLNTCFLQPCPVAAAQTDANIQRTDWIVTKC